MKSYGRIDEFWDDAKFRALIEDTLQMAGERGVPLAVYQDDDGNIIVSRARGDWSFMYACVAVAHRNESTGECKTGLVGVMPYELYTIEQMIPIARDALTRGIFEYDASGPSGTAETPARCRRMRRKDGQDTRRTVHRGHDGQGDNGGADVREAQVRRTGGMRVHRACRMEPA